MYFKNVVGNVSLLEVTFCCLKVMNRNSITLSDPECVASVLRNSKNLNKPSSYDCLRKWLGKGLVTSPAQRWKPTRHLLTSTFHFDILKSFLKIKCERANDLVKILEHHCDHNHDINIEEHLGLCTLDIICETAMGEKVNALTDKSASYPKAVRR